MQPRNLLQPYPTFVCSAPTRRVRARASATPRESTLSAERGGGMVASGGAKKDGPTTYLIAGGIAGVVSRTCIAPIERVKILFQIQSRAGGGGGSWLHMPGAILREEGARAFWKGNTAACVRVMPYMSLTFLSYEEYKSRLLAADVPKQGATLAAGSAAGVTAVVLTYPLDLVRATMATPGCKHTSMLQAMQHVSRERGVLALYSGVSATVVGVAPYAGLKFLSYEALKSAMGSTFGLSEADLKPWQRVCSGLVAGMLAQTAVYPLDVVRRRMQTAATVLYTGPFNALATIAREEGVYGGLYRGLTLNYLKVRRGYGSLTLALSLSLALSLHLTLHVMTNRGPDPCPDDAQRCDLYGALRHCQDALAGLVVLGSRVGGIALG